MSKTDIDKMIDDFEFPSAEYHFRGLLAKMIREELENFAKYVDGLQWANSKYPNAQSLLKDYLKSIGA